MPPARLHSFRLRLLEQPELRAGLGAIADPAAFASAVVERARALGETISLADVEREVRPSSRTPLEWPGGQAAPPAGRWFPHRLVWRDGIPRLTWCDLGEDDFRDPFFEETITRRLALPLNRFLAFETPPAGPSSPDASAPAGLIFHLSRCGSTLAAQMLSTLPGATVLSEPEVLDGILSAHWMDAALTDADRIAWLQGAVSAFQREAMGTERLFIKLDSWHVRSLPLIVAAFPGTPWIFLHRDPVDVLVSHARQRGRQMVPGLLPPGWLELPPGDAAPGDLDAYAARVLARLLEAAVQHHACGSGHIMSYDALREGGWAALAGPLGLTLSEAEIAAMTGIARYHAKRPTETFQSDAAAKRAGATPHQRHLAERWALPAHDALKAIEAAQSSKQATP